MPNRMHSAAAAAPGRAMPAAFQDHATHSQHIAETFRLIAEEIGPLRRVVRAGQTICGAGGCFKNLYLLSLGFAKIVNTSEDGREQLSGLKFRGDWLGFDGLAEGHYTCDAIALDTGEVWCIGYEALISAGRQRPGLLRLLHQAMSRELVGERDSHLAACTLPAEARVAGFLHGWVESLSSRGLRCDQIDLRMTRAEIGNYLGVTLETVSRALSKLARDKVIVFAGGGRRHLHIPDPGALSGVVQRSLAIVADAP